MKGKQLINTTRLDVPLNVNGSGEFFRIGLVQKVHAGPTAVLDRYVTLIMDMEEAAQTALDILKRLPVEFLRLRLKDLQKIVDENT